MVLEIIKYIVPFLFGGLAGALFTDWRRRRDNKVQPIPLIQRVNRLISPELEGITLARVVGDATHRQLEELKNLREYQLTLRNTSTVNLQDAEILFEFPAKDVQAWASRPALSKTPLLNVDATATDPWKKAFRWRIPQFPSGDSVEFTFQAVDPSSELYGVALYKGDRIIIENVVGEPAPKRKIAQWEFSFAIVAAISAILAIGLTQFGIGFARSSDEKLTTINLGGCDLRVVSLYDRYGQAFSSPYRIKDRIFNNGGQSCVVQSEKLDVKGPFTIGPETIFEREMISDSPPKLVDFEVSVGTTTTTLSKTHLQLFVER